MIPTVTKKDSSADLKEPGDYTVIQVDGERGVKMLCPVCGQPATAGGGTDVDVLVLDTDPLTLNPSVICPASGCHYHVRMGKVELVP